MSGTPRYRVIVAAKLLLVGRPFATVCDTHGRCFSIRSMAMSALTCYFARPRNAWSACIACRTERCAVHAMHVLLAAHGMRAILAYRVMRALRALPALYGVHAEHRVRAEVASLAVRAKHAMRCMCAVLG